MERNISSKILRQKLKKVIDISVKYISPTTPRKRSKRCKSKSDMSDAVYMLFEEYKKISNKSELIVAVVGYVYKVQDDFVEKCIRLGYLPHQLPTGSRETKFSYEKEKVDSNFNCLQQKINFDAQNYIEHPVMFIEFVTYYYEFVYSHKLTKNISLLDMIGKIQENFAAFLDSNISQVDSLMLCLSRFGGITQRQTPDLGNESQNKKDRSFLDDHKQTTGFYYRHCNFEENLTYKIISASGGRCGIHLGLTSNIRKIMSRVLLQDVDAECVSSTSVSQSKEHRAIDKDKTLDLYASDITKFLNFVKNCYLELVGSPNKNISIRDMIRDIQLKYEKILKNTLSEVDILKNCSEIRECSMRCTVFNTNRNKLESDIPENINTQSKIDTNLNHVTEEGVSQKSKDYKQRSSIHHRKIKEINKTLFEDVIDVNNTSVETKCSSNLKKNKTNTNSTDSLSTFTRKNIKNRPKSNPVSLDKPSIHPPKTIIDDFPQQNQQNEEITSVLLPPGDVHQPESTNKKNSRVDLMTILKSDITPKTIISIFKISIFPDDLTNIEEIARGIENSEFRDDDPQVTLRNVEVQQLIAEAMKGHGEKMLNIDLSKSQFRSDRKFCPPERMKQVILFITAVDEEFLQIMVLNGFLFEFRRKIDIELFDLSAEEREDCLHKRANALVRLLASADAFYRYIKAFVDSFIPRDPNVYNNIEKMIEAVQIHYRELMTVTYVSYCTQLLFTVEKTTRFIENKILRFSLLNKGCNFIKIFPPPNSGTPNIDRKLCLVLMENLLQLRKSLFENNPSDKIELPIWLKFNKQIIKSIKTSIDDTFCDLVDMLYDLAFPNELPSTNEKLEIICKHFHILAKPLNEFILRCSVHTKFRVQQYAAPLLAFLPKLNEESKCNSAEKEAFLTEYFQFEELLAYRVFGILKDKNKFKHAMKFTHISHILRRVLQNDFENISFDHCMETRPKYKNIMINNLAENDLHFFSFVKQICVQWSIGLPITETNIRKIIEDISNALPDLLIKSIVEAQLIAVKITASFTHMENKY